MADYEIINPVGGGSSGSGLPVAGTPNALIGFDGDGDLNLARELTTDTRDPMSHGEGAHIGIVGQDSQIEIDPADYSGLLGAITGVEPTIADALAVLDVVPLLPPHGRLTVPPAFIQSSGGVTFQMNDANHKVDVSYIPECSYSMPRIAFQVNAVASAGTMNVSIYADDSGAIGALLLDCGTFAVSTTGLLICTFLEAYQFYGNIKVHVVASRVTGDFSLYLRKRSTTYLGEFPDGCQTKITTNGSTWVQATQDTGGIIRNAFLACVFAPTTHGCSSLVYGRRNGDYVALPDVASYAYHSIPLAGVFAGDATEALTADTKYQIYLYDNSGTLALDISATAETWGGSLEVKTGAPTRRLVGICAALNQVSTYQGVVDSSCCRYLVNLYNHITKAGRHNPAYVATTRFTGSAAVGIYERVGNNGDLSVKFVSRANAAVRGGWFGRVTQTNYIGSMAMGVDSTSEPVNEQSVLGFNVGSYYWLAPSYHRFTFSVGSGVHEAHLLMCQDITGSNLADLCQYGGGYKMTMGIDLSLDC